MDPFFEILGKGGMMIIPLVVCSLLMLAVVIDRIIALRRSMIIKPEITSVIESIGKPEDIGLAEEICKRNPGAYSNLVLSGLRYRELPKEEIKEAIQDQGRQEIRSLERGLNILETIAGIAPLLGLLGTVLGMIKVFTVISEQGLGQTNALAGGISEALITTVVGLSIGIPALVAYNYFSHKAEDLILDLEKYTGELIRKLVGFHHAGPREEGLNGIR
ncbi:MAG: hypothetical protein B6244_09690 [Candidatus Cloacimonetes bacterium 4572_55]|nr:MAG: hypothetical protein B6244_09690 [Candidatus Cloacimonetes bacterium 4572_55]